MTSLALQHFFAMGGYALYVWPAYILVSLVLITNVIVPWVKQRKLLRKIARPHRGE